MPRVDGQTAGAFVVALAESVTLWWLYFDRSAGESAALMARSNNPGAMVRAA
jgi:hypothetical protein